MATDDRDAALLKKFKSCRDGTIEQKQALGELLKNLSGAIQTAVNKYVAAPLPQSAIVLEANRLAAEALRDYEPSKSTTSLGTFIITRVSQRLFRYVSQHQNTARIPEEQIRKIGPIREAVTDLSAKLNREPTNAEISDHLGLPLKHIVRIRKNLRADLMGEAGNLGEIERDVDPNMERAMMVYYQLNMDEQQVFDYTMGLHGSAALNMQDIAKKMKVSPGRVSQIKMNIAKKMKPYLVDG